MNKQQLTLTRLLGKKEFTFGCIVANKEMPSFYYKLIAKVYLPGDTDENRWGVLNTNNNSVVEQTIPERLFEVLGHPATLSDLHMWMNEKGIRFRQWKQNIDYCFDVVFDNYMPYDSSKDLLDQSPEILARIIELISNNP